MIRFMKANPTTYVMHYRNGKVLREGPGLSFFYYAPAASIALVPVGSVDVPFVFSLVTSDFQQAAVQGQLTFRIMEPKKLASLLDFSVGTKGTYTSQDPDKLKERLIHAAQVLCQTLVGQMTLRKALTGSEAIAESVLTGLKKHESVTSIGVSIMSFTVLAVRPNPEMAKALEAETRESLQQSADEAIYARRNAAVEQERKIKESELNTELAVQQKQREIRETQMAAEIAVEEQKKQLIDQRSANERKEAETRAYALDAILKPIRDIDWKKLMVVSNGGVDPKAMISLAFRDLAENAQKIGELNITPDLLKALVESAGERNVRENRRRDA